MDAYDQEIFNFLTQPVQYDSLVKAMGHFEKVRKELLRQFWSHVEIDLKELYMEKHQWVIELDKDIFLRNSQIKLYKVQWKQQHKAPLFSVVWESLATNSPFYGLYINQDLKAFGVDAMREYARSLQFSENLIDIRGRVSYDLKSETRIHLESVAL